MEKTVFFIRHGYALHNKLFPIIGTRAYSEFRDTDLMELGYNQASALGKLWHEISNIELILTSPCQRTLKTAMLIFENVDEPDILAQDFLTEFPMGGNAEICNKRQKRPNLEYFYPYVNFDQLKKDDEYWPDNIETKYKLHGRINEMIHYIGQRKEKKIAIVSHSSFIGMFKDDAIGNEQNELKHCFPYKVKMFYDDNGNFLKKKVVTDSN
jgi:broad specificity phosphatase PhoE